MASERFSPVVALEIAGHRRAPADPPGNARSDPTTQSRKSAVECRRGFMGICGFSVSILPARIQIRKYMVKPKGGTEKSQNWLTFLRNHTGVSWGMDFFTAPTIRFQILYVFVVL